MEGAVYSRILAVLTPGFCNSVQITSSRYPWCELADWMPIKCWSTNEFPKRSDTLYNCFLHQAARKWLQQYSALKEEMHSEHQYFTAILTMTDNSEKLGSDLCVYRRLTVKLILYIQHTMSSDVSRHFFWSVAQVKTMNTLQVLRAKIWQWPRNGDKGKKSLCLIRHCVMAINYINNLRINWSWVVTCAPRLFICGNMPPASLDRRLDLVAKRRILALSWNLTLDLYSAASYLVPEIILFLRDGPTWITGREIF